MKNQSNKSQHIAKDGINFSEPPKGKSAYADNIISRQPKNKQDKGGGEIKDYKLETIQMNLSEKKGLKNMGNANYVGFWEIEKPTTLNTQGRISF